MLKKHLGKFFLFFLFIALLLAISQPISEWLGISSYLNHSIHTTAAQDDYPQTTEINFRFKVDSINNKEILFQTAPNNNGIHLEISKNKIKLSKFRKYFADTNVDALGNMLNISVGTTSGKPLLAAQLDDDLPLHTWHTIKIIAWNHHSVKTYLDDVEASNMSDRHINYQVSKTFLNTTTNNAHIQLTKISLHNEYYDANYHEKAKKILNILIWIFLACTLICFFIIAKQPMTRTKKLQYIAFGILLGFFIAVIFHYISSFYYLNLYPSNTFLYYGLGLQFKDFYDMIRIDQILNPYYSHLLYKGQYFPAAYLLVYPLTWVNLHAALLIYYGMFFSGYLFFIRYYLSEQKSQSLHNAFLFLIFGFMSYPILFAFERGNFESLTFLSLAFFLFFYTHNQIYKSILFLVFAAAFKFYPIVFLVLLLSDKHYKAAFLTLLALFALEFLSLCLLKNGLFANLAGLKSSLQGIAQIGLHFPESRIEYNVSLWGMLVLFKAHLLPNFQVSAHNINLYSLGTLVAFAIMSVYIIFIEHCFWKKAALLTCAMLLFPIVSAEYKMVNIYLALFFFIQNKSEKFDLFYSTCFILLLIPTSAHCTGIFVPIILLIMLGFIINEKIIACLFNKINKSKQKSINFAASLK